MKVLIGTHVIPLGEVVSFAIAPMDKMGGYTNEYYMNENGEIVNNLYRNYLNSNEPVSTRYYKVVE